MKKLVLFLSMAILAACAEKTSDKLADAQACLDNAKPAGAQACLSKISGVTGKEAELLRCAAGFITEGLADANTLADAFGELSQASNATVSMMSFLAFDSKGNATDNQTFAQETFDHCNNAGNPGFVLIASVSNMATTLAAVGNLFDGSEITPAELAAALPALAGSTAGKEAIGASAISAYQTSCTIPDPSNEQLCAELTAAGAGNGSSPADVGAALATAWAI